MLPTDLSEMDILLGLYRENDEQSMQGKQHEKNVLKLLDI